jgi:hypothetical protein
MDEFAITITVGDSGTSGAFVEFSNDRELRRRFREAFPRARWHPRKGCWHVPGSRAQARLESWRSRELPNFGRFLNQKGRDAFDFEPIMSPYLTDTGNDLKIETPYSRVIVNVMHQISGASWDGHGRCWRVPYRCLMTLRSKWREIEGAADALQPEAIARRRERKKQATRRNASERRRKRYPVLVGALPPLDIPVQTSRWGVIVFVEVTSEIVEGVNDCVYPFVRHIRGDFIWARWRMPTLAELEAAVPSRGGRSLKSVGWSRPTKYELDQRKHDLRIVDRGRQTRGKAKAAASPSV